MAPYHVGTIATGAALLGIAAVGIGIRTGMHLAHRRAERDATFPAPAVFIERAPPRRPPTAAVIVTEPSERET